VSTTTERLKERVSKLEGNLYGLALELQVHEALAEAHAAGPGAWDDTWMDALTDRARQLVEAEEDFEDAQAESSGSESVLVPEARLNELLAAEAKAAAGAEATAKGLAAVAGNYVVKSSIMQELLSEIPVQGGRVSMPLKLIHLIDALLHEDKVTLAKVDDVLHQQNGCLLLHKEAVRQMFSRALPSEWPETVTDEDFKQAMRATVQKLDQLMALEASAKGRICCGRVMHYHTNAALKCEKCCTILVTG